MQIMLSQLVISVYYVAFQLYVVVLTFILPLMLSCTISCVMVMHMLI